MSKRLWLVVFILASLAFFSVFAVYFLWFKACLDFHLSKSPEVWGQFGDFVGGVLNPILSFITVVILIITTIYQQKQYENSEKRELNKRFDDRFYGMISYQRDLAANFKLALPGGSDADVKDVITYVEDVFFNTNDHSYINSQGFKETIFPVVRAFYILIKMIDESSEDEVSANIASKYYEWVINLSDYHFLRLVFFCSFYYDNISSFTYIRSNKNVISSLTTMGWDVYIYEINKRKQQLGIA